MSFFIVSWK